MAEATYFVQECPTCGRRLQIRVEYLGKRLVCQHCHGSLVASDRSVPVYPGFNILQRATELLELVDQRRPR
ncbi:MAG TPA: hypothetical protein VFI31_24430 [Pirellulales bacterium]|nr:hypothetical protein [Pirellulales bacterium]